MGKKILILEAHKDQAISLKQFLKKDKNNEIYLENSYELTDYSHYDLVIPTSANSTFYFINKFGDLKLGRLTYTKENLITFDKIKTLNLVRDVGVPIPATYTDKNDINFFPIFYKSLREEGYTERGIIKNPIELENFNNPNVFFQEFIWSKGTYSVAFLADRGKLITHFIQKEVLSYPYHGGSAVILERLDDKRLLVHTQKILEAVNYSGWGLVEYKYCHKRRDYVFMEVNAKFWASLKFAFYNDPLFLKYLFNIDIKKRDLKQCVYIDRVLMSNWSEILFSVPYLFKAKWMKAQPITKTIHKRFFKKEIPPVNGTKMMPKV